MYYFVDNLAYFNSLRNKALMAKEPWLVCPVKSGSFRSLLDAILMAKQEKKKFIATPMPKFKPIQTK